MSFGGGGCQISRYSLRPSLPSSLCLGAFATWALLSSNIAERFLPCFRHFRSQKIRNVQSRRPEGRLTPPPPPTVEANLNHDPRRGGKKFERSELRITRVALLPRDPLHPHKRCAWNCCGVCVFYCSRWWYQPSGDATRGPLPQTARSCRSDTHTPLPSLQPGRSGITDNPVCRSELPKSFGTCPRVPVEGSCCLLLQYLIQSCARGGRRIVEDMCYEIRRAEVCVN
jgi:hypothetical protein